VCEYGRCDKVLVGDEADRRALARFGRFNVEMELVVLVRPYGATIGVKVEPKPISAGNARVRCHVCPSQAVQKPDFC
jgi:hypothetical protein